MYRVPIPDFYSNNFYDISNEESQLLCDIEKMMYTECECVDITAKGHKPYYILANQLAQCIAVENSLSWIFDSKTYFPLFPQQIKNKCNNKIKPLESVKYKLHKEDRAFIAKLFYDSINNGNLFELISVPNKRYTTYKLPFENVLPFSLHFLFQFKCFKLKKIDNPNKASLLDMITNSLDLLKVYTPKNKERIVSYKEHLSLVYLLHHLDEKLKLFKIVQMNHWKNVIISNEAMDFFCKKLDLKYKDIINLKQYYLDNIFHDTEFIDFCLTSKHPDPFNILFHTIKSTINNYQKTKFEHEDKTSFEYLIVRKPDIYNPYMQNKKLPDTDYIEMQMHSDSFDLMEFFSFCKSQTKKYICNFDKELEKHIAFQQEISYSFDFEDEIDKKIKSVQESKAESKIESEIEIKAKRDFSKKLFTWRIDLYLSFLRSKKVWDTVFFEKEFENTRELFSMAQMDTDKQETYWNEYYFLSQNVLNEYLKSPDSEEYKYMSFLFDIVAENLSQFS